MARFKSEEIPIDKILLDPNNYRFQDDADFVRCEEDRIHLDSVQDGTYRRLRTHGIKELKDSILSNGFLPVERIVVCRYEHEETTFLVIDGNRRLAGLIWIKEDSEAGVAIPEGVLGVVDAVPCVILEEEGEEFIREALMGVRHVGGIKEWGGYQRARLIASLRDGHDLDPQIVAQRLGLSTREVNRRYRAYKALEQMQEDEEFGDLAKPAMYPLFHEVIAIPVVREWLAWNLESCQFENKENLRNFYILITPLETDDASEQKQEEKIKTFSAVRELKEIIPNRDATKALLDPTKSFFDAVSIAKKKELSLQWRAQLEVAIDALKSITAFELTNLDQEGAAIFEELNKMSAQVIMQHNKLSENDD